MSNKKLIKQPVEESTFDFSEQQSKEIATFKFSKQQLVSSKKYAFQRDVLNALLKDGQVYTFSEVDQQLNDFLKGKVKK
ncbi:hypothetical protein MPH47_19455 [Psychrobacillus psychrodurans]|uniref:hypothetical protein n=1 Tax=Psychrobacillus psychrodurans TaxID=126157 RepID=UPI001F4EB034|nr:hypothetical protein [Psychrobacillus psychrodurans]MCK1999374.1 hypothetical protein [Psychrobacillus psychrodurans]